MKIIRFLDDQGEHLGRQHDDGCVTLLAGNLFGTLTDTGTPATVEKLLAPLEPRDILCIGLNYRKHAAEGGLPLIRIGDVHLEQHDRVTLWEFIVRRFVAWQAEKEELFAELYEYLETAPEEDVAHLTEDGILDPIIDPTVIFDLRHPFPGTAELAHRIYTQFGIA